MKDELEKHYQDLDALIATLPKTLERMMPHVKVESPNNLGKLAESMGTHAALIIEQIVLQQNWGLWNFFETGRRLTEIDRELTELYEKPNKPNKLKPISSGYHQTPHLFGIETKKQCEKLLKNISTLLEQIRIEEDMILEPRKLDKKLNQSIKLRHNYYDTTFFHTSKQSLSTPDSYIEITVRDAVDVFLPQKLILMHFDEQYDIAYKKYKSLEKEHKPESKIYQAAFNMMKAALDGRKAFITAENVQEGLKAMEDIINPVYEQNEKEFATHRGIHKNAGEYDAINIALDLLRGLQGIVVAILNVPGWITAPKQTKALVNSYFERPKTDSLKVFGVFKQETSLDNLQEMVNKFGLKK